MGMTKHRDKGARLVTHSGLPHQGLAKLLVPILPAFVIYSLIAYHLNFTQDDAYITFRYVANYLNGHGLVYNIGERIEGFTNFGWTIYLIAWGALGVSYIAVAKITGFLLGAGAIFVTHLMARWLFRNTSQVLALVPPYLLACNQSLAYWSPAGLETAAFTFLVTLNLFLFLKRSRLLAVGLLLAVWLRPEGALVAGIFIAVEAGLSRGMPRYSIGAAAIAMLLSLPWLGFKWHYYGSIIPNPFFAKTGFTVDQIRDGLNYAGQFFWDYGFLGITWLIPLVLFRKLSYEMKVVWLFCVLYTVYLVMIGGDVLKVHRFFLPIVGASAMLVACTLQLLLRAREKWLWYASLAAAGLILSGLTYTMPKNVIERFNYAEKGLIASMTALATSIRQTDSTDFSAAASTIGIFGYELLGHDVIDMLGLTDSIIARHPEDLEAGMKTTWKERNFNAAYILTRAPDYIVFSTGAKPSAPAEITLLLYPQFVHSYRTTSWWHVNSISYRTGRNLIAFRKVRQVEMPLHRTYPLEWVQLYRNGLNAYTSRDYPAAISMFEQALAISGSPQYPEMLHVRALCYNRMSQRETALRQLDSLLLLDSLCEGAQKELYMNAFATGDTSQVETRRRWLERHCPWDITRLDQAIGRKATE